MPYRVLYGSRSLYDPFTKDAQIWDASLSASSNASQYFDFSMSYDHPLVDDVEIYGEYVYVYFDGTLLFRGLVEDKQQNNDGTWTVSCVDNLAFLSDTLVRPYSTIGGEQDLTAPASLESYFEWLIDQHNEHAHDSRKIFKVKVNQAEALYIKSHSGEEDDKEELEISNDSYPTTAAEIEDQILNEYGGYLVLEYDDDDPDTNYVSLYSDIYTANAQILDYGENVTDFSVTYGTDELYTALLPTGNSPEELDEEVVYMIDSQGTDVPSENDEDWDDEEPETEEGDYLWQRTTVEYSNDVIQISYSVYYEPTTWTVTDDEGNETEESAEQTDEYVYYTVTDSTTTKIPISGWILMSYTNSADSTITYIDEVDTDPLKKKFLWTKTVDYYSDDAETVSVECEYQSSFSIDITDEPDGGVLGYDNVVKEDDVIFDRNAVDKYGYRETTWAGDTSDSEELLEKAAEELETMVEPEIEVDVCAVDCALYMDGYSHLKVGQAVRVRSAVHDFDEYLMVVSISLNLHDPANSAYELGRETDTVTGETSSYLSELNNAIVSQYDEIVALESTVLNMVQVIEAI